MQKVFLDAGHGGADSGACALGLREKDVALDIVLKIKDILVSKGLKVDSTRVIDVYVPYQQVGAIANNKKSDIFVSVHCNASKLHNAQGFEVLHHTNSVEGKKLAEDIRQEFLKDRSLYTTDRGLKPRSDLAVLNSTKMPAVLVECAFIDNPSDNFILRNKKPEIAQAIANGIFKYLGISEKGNLGKTPILSKPTATLEQMKAFAELKAPKKELSSLADIYYLKAQALGINPVMAFSQMCHETGFLYQVKSAAGIDASYHNPCGLKISKGGGDFQASAHKKFDTWHDGISAHLDHLALYAGVDGFPKANTLDPRHFAGIFGRGRYVEDLGGTGKWAPSEEYPNKLLKIMKEIENTRVDDKMQINENKDLKNEPRIIPIILNGKNPTVTSVNIDGCEYVKLRDLATLGVFELSNQGKTPVITTK